MGAGGCNNKGHTCQPGASGSTLTSQPAPGVLEDDPNRGRGTPSHPAPAPAPSTPPPLPRLYTYEQAGALLGGVSRWTIQRLVRQGDIAAVDIGGNSHTRRLLADSVEAYLRRVAGGDEN